MKLNKPLIITILMFTMLFTSYVAIASEYGSKEDPLVSLSYIKDVLMPSTLDDVSKIVEDNTKKYIEKLDDKLDNLDKDFDFVKDDPEFVNKVANLIEGQNNTSQVVDVKNGDVLTFNAGSEIILRSGTASANDNILNLTTGANISSGQSIAINNLHLIAENDISLTITQDAKIIVYGGYTVS